MRGTIRGKGKDSWQISFYTGKIVNGKRERHFETVHAHRKSDAQLVLNERLVGKEKGESIPRGRLTVADHLNQWLDGYVKTNCSTRTLEGYKSIIDHHLSASLGHIKLNELKAPAIQAYYGKACETLSGRTVHHQHRVLSQSFKYAVRQGYLSHNPCENVDPPSPRKKIMRTMTPAEVEVLLETAQTDYYYPVIYSSLCTGLRQAECLGLRWRDVDLDMLSISANQVLYIRGGVCEFKEPKTAHNRRRINMTPKLAIFLRGYQKKQAALHLISGKPLTLDSLVFAHPDGKHLNPSVASHTFHKLAGEAGITGVRWHDMRHTFSSLLLLKGVSPKVISECLGHASVAFTMDTYSHIIEGMQSDAMALLDEVLPAGKNTDFGKLTPN